MASYEATPASSPSRWALGGLIFAGTILVIAGTFQALAGLSALLNGAFYVVSDNYAFRVDVTTWGWFHLVLGVVMVAGGAALFAGRSWAGVLAIVVAVVSAIANFLFIPYYPFWSLLVIGLDFWVIWSVTRPGVYG
ncbi:MAG: hypothetical protein E6I45_10535 [Chloroflexi bacterium]|nr:MAG: hypothetical protein E6I45_10535 [Chloroflexota bacterium]